MTALRLRDWQEDALRRTHEREAAGCRRQLGHAATGLGKTVVFSALAEQRGGRCVVIAHRDELIAQTVRKLAEVMPDLGLTDNAREALALAGHVELVKALPRNPYGIGVVKGPANDLRAHAIAASVQTLSRKARLAQLQAAQVNGTMLVDPAAPIDLLVIDEAHHASSPSYRRVITELRAGEPDGPLLLGVTATPDRGDGKPLDMFDEVVWSYDMLWGIRSGYLADVRGKRVRLDRLDLDGVKVSRGDYDEGETGRALVAAGAPEAVAASWAAYCSGRPTLVFCPTVDMSHRTAAELSKVGARAGHVDGAMDLDERRGVLRRFAAGELDVVSNCMVLTEGYDEPSIGCIIVARPTKSRGLYTQMVGRGTRLHPAKSDLLVVDLVGASDTHSLVTVPSLFGVKASAKVWEGGGSVAAIVAEEEAEAIRLGQLRAEDVELFKNVRAGGIAWVAVHREGDELRRFVRPLPAREENGKRVLREDVVLAQRVAGADVWTSGLLWPDGRKTVLIANVSMELAQGVAEDYARREGGQLVVADARWRKGRPSPNLLAACKAWHMKVEPKWNAGEVSDALNAHVARIKARPKGSRRRKAKAG